MAKHQKDRRLQVWRHVLFQLMLAALSITAMAVCCLGVWVLYRLFSGESEPRPEEPTHTDPPAVEAQRAAALDRGSVLTRSPTRPQTPAEPAAHGAVDAPADRGAPRDRVPDEPSHTQSVGVKVEFELTGDALYLRIDGLTSGAIVITLNGSECHRATASDGVLTAEIAACVRTAPTATNNYLAIHQPGAEPVIATVDPDLLRSLLGDVDQLVGQLLSE